ncbi:ATP-dependent DNA helicase [Cupriavidus taiwanensis]|uniref:ATP-dependent DNA helicase n=1 Tax=Cupriavidus taiwanensis TaxID=164546 RepID=UPI000E2EFFB3|nr:ATP-dependent DNA helicase [Cupriavidus taiwanensis]
MSVSAVTSPPPVTPAPSAAPAQPAYVVAVRALCEFTAKAGDLDLRFVPTPSAQEGVAGHGVVTGRRGAGYQAELALSADFGPLRVRGRADGYDPAANRLEEIKTVRGDAAVPDNHRHLHWAQAKIYGCLLCRKLGLPGLEIAVVYFDIVSQREHPVVAHFDAPALEAFFVESCERFLHWAQAELAHRQARDAALARLAFPHQGFRPGQRELAQAVYNANRAGRHLLAQAPTGIGKSVGTLFPVLKAMPGQGLDKVFFLSARSTGRGVALHAAAALRSHGAQPLRVLELTARDKACEHPELACHGESCPLARGFYDRLPAAREAARAMPVRDRSAVRELAREHAICPYYLAQELVRWSDVVVADYNYYFDRSAMLYALTVANGWRASVLVDEAHNLVERGRAMYTAELDPQALRDLRRGAPAPLARPLARLARQWNVLARQGDEAYQVLPEVPAVFRRALDECCEAALAYLTEHPGAHDPALQRFYFDALHFGRLAEQLDAHSLFDIQRAPRRRGHHARLCLRNVIPAPFLRPRLAAAHSVTLFSATLDPAGFYLDTLGLPADCARVQVPAPFRADQLSVRIAARISTRYARRAQSLPAIVALMAQQFRARRGNYLAFFSSHEYLQQAVARFAAAHPEIPHWVQARGMDEAAQAAFLQAFAEGGEGIGFAVLGGAFAEGVDLPGERLIGAFVATLGLPQFNPVNEQFRARMEQAFGQGYAYAYLYPGLRKVVQAAGRVIRTQQDQGVLYLIDDRFAAPEVRELLPSWWEIGWESRCEIAPAA